MNVCCQDIPFLINKKSGYVCLYVHLNLQFNERPFMHSSLNIRKARYVIQASGFLPNIYFMLSEQRLSDVQFMLSKPPF